MVNSPIQPVNALRTVLLLLAISALVLISAGCKRRPGYPVPEAKKAEAAAQKDAPTKAEK